MNRTHKCGQDTCKHGKGPGCPNIVTEQKGLKKNVKFNVQTINNNNYNLPYINSEYLHLTYTVKLMEWKMHILSLLKWTIFYLVKIM